MSSAATKSDFEVSGYAFVNAAAEQLRPAREVRVGLVQNKIVLPTTAPVFDQREALYRRIGEMIDAAGQSGVNVLCLQEAWSERLKNTL